MYPWDMLGLGGKPKDGMLWEAMNHGDLLII